MKEMSITGAERYNAGRTEHEEPNGKCKPPAGTMLADQDVSYLITPNETRTFNLHTLTNS